MKRASAAFRAASWLGLLLAARLFLETLHMPEPVGETAADVAPVALRLVADGLWWYLAGLTALTAVAQTVRASRRLGRAADLPLPGARAMVQVLAGLGVGVSTLSTVGPAAATPPPTLPREPADGTLTAEPPPPTLQREPADGTLTAEPPPPTPPPTPPQASPVSTHTVRAGESFWTISELTLATHLGRTPTDAEIVPHWLAVIELNRDRLVDPADPDLIHPGLLIDVPPA